MRSGKGTERKRAREFRKQQWREEKLRRKQERLLTKEN
jgi:hypothetical protein